LRSKHLTRSDFIFNGYTKKKVLSTFNHDVFLLVSSTSLQISFCFKLLWLVRSSKNDEKLVSEEADSKAKDQEMS